MSGSDVLTPAGWWGAGPSPVAQWPGVTIPIDDDGGRFVFDAARADRVCEFFPRFCSHSKGPAAGQRFELLPYQRDLILRPLFGWIEAVDGRRRFRKAYIQIPKKQGKTQLIAGLALYMLLADGEPGPEVYVAAADRDQARILFEAAVQMIAANPYLAARCVVFRNEIRRADNSAAFFKVLSAEAATKHGPNIHCLVIDELHAQPDRELFETLTRGVLARRQPLTLLITTAGDDDESICYEEYEYAKRVLSGTVTDRHHLPVIFEARGDEDPWSPATWRRVNPALGVTVEESIFEGFAVEARNEPRKRNDFFRFNLNRWVNPASAWLPVEWWDACDQPLPAEAELAALPCCAGLDLAQKIDLACCAVVCRVPVAAADALTVEVVVDDGRAEPVKVAHVLNYRIVVVPYFWIPEDTARERARVDKVPYLEWAAAGLVTLTPGVTIDYDRIYADITGKIARRFPKLRIGGFAYDPAFASDIAGRLRELAGYKAAEVLQNYSHLSEVCHLFEALIKARRVAHGGHRVLRNHVENVAVRRDDAGRIRPVKPKKAAKRIDGVVATVIGLKALAAQPLTAPVSLHVW